MWAGAPPKRPVRSVVAALHSCLHVELFQQDTRRAQLIAVRPSPFRLRYSWAAACTALRPGLACGGHCPRVPSPGVSVPKGRLPLAWACGLTLLWEPHLPVPSRPASVQPFFTEFAPCMVFLTFHLAVSGLAANLIFPFFTSSTWKFPECRRPARKRGS